MKQLVLLAIVAVSIIGATTAFATSNFINITAIQSLGASNDVAIPTDIHAASVNFSTCQNYFGLIPAGTNPNTDCATVRPGVTIPNTILYAVDDCLITDTTDTIPNGEVVTCKLTAECATTAINSPPTVCTTITPVVGEGNFQVVVSAAAGSNIGGTVNAGGTATVCSAAVPCHIDVQIQTPAPGLVDVQTVGDVKIIAKGPAV